LDYGNKSDLLLLRLLKGRPLQYTLRKRKRGRGEEGKENLKVSKRETERAIKRETEKKRKIKRQKVSERII
jgi:hypothetical protein